MIGNKLAEIRAVYGGVGGGLDLREHRLLCTQSSENSLYKKACKFGNLHRVLVIGQTLTFGIWCKKSL